MKYPQYTFLVFSALGLLLTACGTAPMRPKVILNVFADSLLKNAFAEIKSSYETKNPGISLTYHFAGSQRLEKQLANGAAADVFASADQLQMQKASDAGLVGESQIFANNQLIVIVPLSNAAKIYTLKDLAHAGVKIALADAAVPAGQYSLQVLDNLGKSADYGPTYENSVNANVVSHEASVEVVAQKVQLAEVDAGIVYQSDITPLIANRVVAIDIPSNLNVLAQYPIAIAKHTSYAKEAQAFVHYLLSSDGQTILTKYHFSSIKQ